MLSNLQGVLYRAYRIDSDPPPTLRLVAYPSFFLPLPGIEIVQLFFPGRVSASVEEKPAKPEVEVPTRCSMRTLKSIPDFAHVEKTEFDQKETRLQELEAYMDECADPTANFAVEVLDVHMTEEEAELRHTNYHEYAMVAIRNAEKCLRAEALLLHPDV